MSGSSGDAAFPLVYAISAARPQVDISFEIDADGTFSVDVLTGPSLPQPPPLRLGRFRGRVDRSVAARLAGIVQRTAGTGSPATQPFDTPARLLGSRGGPLVPMSDAAEGADLDRILAEAAMLALRTPVAAVEISVEVRPGDSGAGDAAGTAAAGADAADSSLVVRAIGTESFPLVVFDAAQAAYWARIWRDEPGSPEGRVYLGRDRLEALAAGGRIVDGAWRVEPGAAAVLPLPDGAGETGGFSFWRAGAGPERRAMAGTWSLGARRSADETS